MTKKETTVVVIVAVVLLGGAFWLFKDVGSSVSKTEKVSESTILETNLVSTPIDNLVVEDFPAVVNFDKPSLPMAGLPPYEESVI